MPPLLRTSSGARGALLSVLAHFFEHGRWGCPAETVVEGQNLAAEDQLFLLMQAGLYHSSHARILSTGGANLLRVLGVVVSSA